MRRTLPSWLLFALGFATLASGSSAVPAPRRAEVEVDLAEGLDALDRGDAPAAIDWLEKAAKLDPEMGTPRYRQGIALARLGQVREAAAEIEASLAAPQPVDDRGLWEGAVGLSAAEDSNPHLLSNNLSLPAPGAGGKVVRGEESDGLARADLRLGIYPFHARQGPNLGVTLETRRSFFFNFGYLDLGQARGAIQLAFGSDPQGFVEGPLGSSRISFDGDRFTALFQAGGAVYHLGNDPYLHTVDGAAVLGVRETPGTSTRLDLGYSDRTFSGGPRFDPQRSGQNLSLGLSQIFYFGGPNRTLRLGATGVDRRAGPAFAGSSLEGNGEWARPLGLRWSALLEGRVRKDRYDRPESNLFDSNGPARHDTTVQSAATLIWAASARLRWMLRGAYTRRNSNVDLGDGLPDLGYRRTVISAGLSWEL